MLRGIFTTIGGRTRLEVADAAGRRPFPRVVDQHYLAAVLARRVRLTMSPPGLRMVVITEPSGRRTVLTVWPPLPFSTWTWPPSLPEALVVVVLDDDLAAFFDDDPPILGFDRLAFLDRGGGGGEGRRLLAASSSRRSAFVRRVPGWLRLLVAGSVAAALGAAGAGSATAAGSPASARLAGRG